MLLDREEIDNNRNERVATILRYLGVIMAIFYFTLGIMVLSFSFIEGLSTAMRYTVGLLLMVYGGFRFYRVFKKQE